MLDGVKKLSVAGLSVGFFSTFFIRSFLEYTLGWAGISTAYYALSIGVVALILYAITQRWRLHQLAISLGAALVGGILGLALALSRVQA